jgi:Fic family protein
MNSFIDLDRTFGSQPRSAGLLLQRADIGRGREDLYRDQLPELLETLSENARVASIRASSAIEGVEVGTDRALGLARGGVRYRNRNEKEFAGYRDAIDGLIGSAPEPVSVPLLLHLHRELYRHSGGRGGNFKLEANSIVSYEGGRREIVFEPPDEHATPFLMEEAVNRYNDALEQRAAHPLVLLSAFVLDLLAIHPVADGNGRLARLVTTSELMRLGYGVVRYVSVEQQIYETKNAYYASLYDSQQGWHDAEHTIWPWTEYLLTALGEAYDIFEARVAAERSVAGGSKQDRVRVYLTQHAPREFRLADVRAANPGVSDQTIRIVANELKDGGTLTVEGRGRGAVWRRTGV